MSCNGQQYLHTESVRERENERVRDSSTEHVYIHVHSSICVYMKLIQSLVVYKHMGRLVWGQGYVILHRGLSDSMNGFVTGSASETAWLCSSVFLRRGRAEMECDMVLVNSEVCPVCCNSIQNGQLEHLLFRLSVTSWLSLSYTSTRLSLR